MAQPDSLTASAEKISEKNHDRLSEVVENDKSEIVEPHRNKTDEDAASFQLAPSITEPDNEGSQTLSRRLDAPLNLTRTSTRPYTSERFHVEQTLSAQKLKSCVIAPTKTEDGTILVDWYTTDDPTNPQNWPAWKKAWVLLQLGAYSLAVYGASSMYVPGEQDVMEHFNIGSTPAAVGLAIYVIGYGIGPLLFAPLSEIAAVGRNWVYIPTFCLFVILSIPTAMIGSYAGLLVLRFLTGFFGSPCLSNGGATVGDMVGCSSTETGSLSAADI